MKVIVSDYGFEMVTGQTLDAGAEVVLVFDEISNDDGSGHAYYVTVKDSQLIEALSRLRGWEKTAAPRADLHTCWVKATEEEIIDAFRGWRLGEPVETTYCPS